MKLLGIDELFGDLVEVVAHPLDSRSLARPPVEIATVRLRSDDLLKMLKDEEALGELIQRFIVVSQGCTVPIGSEQAVAQSVNGGDLELGEVSCISNLAGGGREAIAELKSSLLREGAEHQLTRRRLAKEEQIQRPQYQTKVLPAPGPAMTRSGPSLWLTMARCASFSAG